VRPLAKAPLFQHPLIGLFLRGLAALPVYRRRDDPSLTHLNERTFDAAVDALHRGDAVQIFPEGTSHSEPSLAPLRTGAARIALLAEARADWSLGLAVVPVGLTYARKTLFRSRALAAVGRPFTVTEHREAYERDVEQAVRTLTERITKELEAVTLNLSTRADRELIETAERLYTRSRGAPPEARERLAARLPRLQQFAEGLAWLRVYDPLRHARLVEAIELYRQRSEQLGAEAGEVPSRYHPVAVLSYLVRHGVALAVGLPLAALGLLAWYVPYLLPRVVLRFLKVTEDSVATYKLILALLIFPLFYAGWITAAWLTLGPLAALAATVLLPPLGVIALRWSLRWESVREDVRVFLRVLRHPRAHDQLALERERIADEIDAVRGQIG